MSSQTNNFYNKTVLPNGIRILTERMENVRSVSLGFWVKLGSRDETPALRGGTHFLEHLLFKGTTSRSAVEISKAFDSRGADLNAFSSKETTCYYTRLLDEHLPMGIEILSDMLQNPLLKKEDIDSERNVILEEIGLHEDTPDDVIHDLFLETLWPEHPLGKPVIGTRETVSNMTKGQLEEFYVNSYAPGSIVVSAAGDINHDKLVQMIDEHFVLDRVGKTQRDLAQPVTETSISVMKKSTEQAHIYIGLPGITVHSPKRFALLMLDTILGGGMSSRLFQEIREKKGLVYSVYSQHALYTETGYFSIYAGTSPGNAEKVINMIMDELMKIAVFGITDEEHKRSQDNIKGSLILNLESTGHRMGRLGKAEIIGGEILALDEIIERINNVSKEDINNMAKELISQKKAVLAVVGPFEQDAFDFFKDKIA